MIWILDYVCVDYGFWIPLLSDSWLWIFLLSLLSILYILVLYACITFFALHYTVSIITILCILHSGFWMSISLCSPLAQAGMLHSVFWFRFLASSYAIVQILCLSFCMLVLHALHSNIRFLLLLYSILWFLDVCIYFPLILFYSFCSGYIPFFTFWVQDVQIAFSSFNFLLSILSLYSAFHFLVSGCCILIFLHHHIFVIAVFVTVTFYIP